MIDGDQHFEQALSAEGPAFLQLEASKHANLQSYALSLLEMYGQLPIVVRLATASVLVEVEDKALGLEEETPAANCFLTGTMVGLRVLFHFVPQNVRHNLLNTEVAQLSVAAADTPEERAELGIEIIEKAEQGYGRAGAYHELLEAWEEQATPDIRYQHFFGHGFGYVMEMLHEVREELWSKDREAFKARLDEPERIIDWDKELTTLLDPPDSSD